MLYGNWLIGQAFINQLSNQNSCHDSGHSPKLFDILTRSWCFVQWPLNKAILTVYILIFSRSSILQFVSASIQKAGLKTHKCCQTAYRHWIFEIEIPHFNIALNKCVKFRFQFFSLHEWKYESLPGNQPQQQPQPNYIVCIIR